MNVIITYFAQLGRVAGRPSQTIALEAPCTAQELVRRIVEEHGESFRELVLDTNGELRRSILLFVGQCQVDWDTPHPLRHGDELFLATPVAGG